MLLRGLTANMRAACRSQGKGLVAGTDEDRGRPHAERGGRGAGDHRGPEIERAPSVSPGGSQASLMVRLADELQVLG